MLQKRALLSVSDKTGLLDLASALYHAGYELISTGGTAKELSSAKIPVTSIESLTGFPECLSGRVKTLHPKVFGGILFRRSDAEHVRQVEDLQIPNIDIVVVNLYPFAATVKKFAGDTSERAQSEIIEQIDIGGPSLLRAAAKNANDITVLCDPTDYLSVIQALQSEGKTNLGLRRSLAAKVFAHTAAYDSAIAEQLSGGATKFLPLTKEKALRYGENPHQWGKYSLTGTANCPWKQLQGKEMSYLNILDADAAWRMVQEFSEPTAVFVKHANPSGIASHPNIAEAFQRAYDTDRLSAFGVIIALNKPCTEEIAKKLIDQKIFTEIIVAPAFEAAALTLLSSKTNLRLLQVDPVFVSDPILYRSAFGGILTQDDDRSVLDPKKLTCVTKKQPTEAQIRDLLFAWKVVKHAKSNAIVLANNSTTIGIGCGQTSRVDSTWIALKRAGEKAKNSVLASDAFFPFPDALEEAAKHGISAVIQPGGSIRDAEVFKRADELGITMLTTGIRVFRH